MHYLRDLERVYAYIIPAVVGLEYTIQAAYLVHTNIIHDHLLKGCKELQEEVNKLKAERDQAWGTSAKLETSNTELRDSSNAFRSQLDAALKV